jgi:hypothetical protein
MPLLLSAKPIKFVGFSGGFVVFALTILLEALL